VAGPGDIYVGFDSEWESGGVTPEQYPAAIDENATQNRSYVAGMSSFAPPDYNNIGNDDEVGTIEDLSGGALSGNWMIRASGQTGGGGTCGTPAPTPSATATACAAGGGGWTAGAPMPNTLVRSVGVYFPSDGMFYSMGGRIDDTAGDDFQHVLQYNPATNTWTQMGVTLPDNNMNNMACGVLSPAGTPYIYCVGGSAATQVTGIARVFYYDPATDTVTTLTSADDWPGDASGTILPGGFAVSNNKLYILGGFDINVASTNGIYEFDPTAAAGSKWTTETSTTPVGIMYAPTAAMGGLIYVLGASDYQGGTVVDTNTTFSFDPATDTIDTTLLDTESHGRNESVADERWDDMGVGWWPSGA
jgi:hypothetical protein